jgi:hypothetical protein
MKQENEQDNCNIPLDEILSEILWRTYQLKQKAQEIQDDKSLLKRIIRWMHNSKN